MKDYFKLLNKFNDQKIRSNTIDLLDDNMNSVGTEVVVEIPLSFKYTV